MLENKKIIGLNSPNLYVATRILENISPESKLVYMVKVVGPVSKFCLYVGSFLTKTMLFTIPCTCICIYEGG